MKNLIIIFILAFCATIVNAQIKVLGKIEPNGPTDTYPTHVDSLGRGGFVAVKTWQERNSIPLPRRKAGMMVSVKSVTVDSLYKLGVGLTNADWMPYAPTADVSGKANLTGGNTFTGTQTIDGNVGIGLTSPSSKFHVRLGTDKNILFRDNGSNSEIVSVNNAFNNYKPLNFAASEYYFNADIYAGIHSITAANLIGDVTGNLNGTATNWGPLNFSYINEGTIPTHFLVSENIDDGVIKYSDVGDVKTALGMNDKASLSLDNIYYGMNTFNDVFNNGIYYALNGFQGPSIMFYAAPLSSYGVVLDMDTDSPPTQEERIKIPSKSGTLALMEQVLAMTEVQLQTYHGGDIAGTTVTITTSPSRYKKVYVYKAGDIVNTTVFQLPANPAVGDLVEIMAIGSMFLFEFIEIRTASGTFLNSGSSYLMSYKWNGTSWAYQGLE